MDSAAHKIDVQDYRVRVLVEPSLSESGVIHGRSGEQRNLPWSEIRCVIAAEVGEPQGVRTIIFDLIGADDNGHWIAFRLDAEPGCDAMEMARALQIGVGLEQASASLKSLAIDATPTRWYPDLSDFENDALNLLSAFDAPRG